MGSVSDRSRTHLNAPRRVRIERGIYRNPSTGRLEVQFTDAAGRIRWKTIDGDLADARTVRATAQGRRAPQARSTRRFREVGDDWLKEQTHLRPRTHALYETALRRHLYPRLGEQRLPAIDADLIAATIADLQQQGLSGWTVRGILVPLGRVLNQAVRQGQISENPLRLLERHERPRVVRRDMRILSREEIPRLISATPMGYRAAIATAVFSGLRQGELLGLRWDDIDFDGGVIHVRCQLTRAGTYGPPKTERAIRDVILTPSLATQLREHRETLACSGSDQPVFATRTGRPINHRNLARRGLARAAEDAGINRPGAARLRFHDLRHTYASLLVAAGLNVLFVSRQLGHANASMTLDVYGGLFDRAEHARRAVDSLEAAFTAAASPSAETAA